MCIQCDPQVEILKVPALIREHGWSCGEVTEGFMGGGSGPIFTSGEGDNAIRGYTGVAFNVTARGDDLKVRIGWPGQFTTSFSCDSADQVMMWLSRMIAIAEKDLKDRMISHV